MSHLAQALRGVQAESKPTTQLIHVVMAATLRRAALRQRHMLITAAASVELGRYVHSSVRCVQSSDSGAQVVTAWDEIKGEEFKSRSSGIALFTALVRSSVSSAFKQ